MRPKDFKDSLVLLRFPFSIFLLPTFFFAWSECALPNTGKLALVFVILHLLVYPASNGYNSYMDRDTGSIGGLETPPPPNRLLLRLTIVFDLAAIILSFLVNTDFTIGLMVYILCSRAYSYRGIRLKKYPITGFLTVFLVQGAVTYWMIFKGICDIIDAEPSLTCMAVSSTLIGALYPLTQIYQFKEDAADGVTSISMLVGYRGTFVLSLFQFLTAAILLYLHYSYTDTLQSFFVFSICMLPAVAYFFYWFTLVYKDERAANFKNSLKMNVIASICTNTTFIVLIFLRN